jgi:hypothetical protein
VINALLIPVALLAVVILGCLVWKLTKFAEP